jgi:formylglycine-generating enzyme required for sulfatase activity
MRARTSLAPTVFVASLLIAVSVPAATMSWTPIGSLGNACDPTFQGCFGAVGYGYSIATYEVTNAQYAEFLNAKASDADDPFGLYNPNMASGVGGIARSGSPGSFSYAALAGRENLPVDWVSFADAARFANWMNNGQGDGDTETGSYALIPGNESSVTRNPGALIALPTANEWYKAAYYSAATASYFDYPTASNATPICSGPTSAPNHAACHFDPGFNDRPYPIGSYPGSASAFGTFDQGGNVGEWQETITQAGYGPARIRAGGDYASFDSVLASQSSLAPQDALQEDTWTGFRLVLLPEPGSGVLVMAGLLGIAGWRRVDP